VLDCAPNGLMVGPGLGLNGFTVELVGPNGVPVPAVKEDDPVGLNVDPVPAVENPDEGLLNPVVLPPYPEEDPVYAGPGLLNPVFTPGFGAEENGVPPDPPE